MPRKLKPSALNSQAYFPHDLTIAPEVLGIQTSVTGPGQDMEWLWTWTTSSLPYSRVTITTQAQTSVPLYRQGTYQIDNFAGVETHSGMTQTHSLYLKWIEGAGTANLVPWVTYQNSGVTASHPSINGGTTTQVQRLIINVPSNLTIPTSLTAPNISYNVSTTAGAYVFMGNAHGNNPNIGPFYRGGTYTFNLSNATGHPFYLTEDSGAGFVAGQYVDEWTSGVTNSRAESGSVTFVVPEDAPDVLYYQCGNHASMRGTIRIKDLAIELNNNGNPIVYFQHTQDNHVTPVELRPIPSLVNQMCVVYDASTGKFVPQDLATYIERTPSFKNKIQEVAGTATLVNADGTPAVSSVKIYPYSNYLPLIGNNAGDVAFTEDTDSLYVWNGTQWKATGTPAAISDKLNTSTGAIDVPAGTTAQRPASPSLGMIRYNITLGFLEQYTADGWQGIAPPPAITTVSPTSYNGEQGTVITVNGSNFDNTVIVKFITAQGAEYAAATTTRISASQLTATTPQDFTVAQEPLKVKVINGSGLSYVLDNAIDCGSNPVWSTASNTLASVFVGSTVNTSIGASDSDASSSVSYSIASGSLPTGVSLNSSTGAITGTTSGSSGTYTFTARVTDNAGNTADRSFSIVLNSLPTGGSVSTSGSYRIHTFTSSDNFVTSATLSNLEVLMVAGGGSGGSGNNNEGGGGGGAGGLLYGTTSLSAGTYGVSIGAGGSGNSNGNSTTFNGWTANGGGYGANCDQSGGNGGSGGGGSGCGQDRPGGSANQGSQGPLTGYGNPGALGHWTGGGSYHSDGQGGGGGGAGSAGQEYRTNGSGRTYGISGSNVNYAVGGYGGAGRSGNYCGANGGANTGTGGEGSVNCNPSGGSGIVILRYQV